MRLPYHDRTNGPLVVLHRKGKGEEFRWDPPYHHEPVDSVEVLVILGKVNIAIKYMKSEGAWPPPPLDCSPAHMGRTFTLPKPNICECPAEGFSIEIITGPGSSAKLRYRDGGKLLRVGVDIHPGGVKNHQWSKAWEYPFNHSLLTLQKQVDINCNIIAAINYMRSAGAWPPPR
jgi:hypothetical protein